MRIVAEGGDYILEGVCADDAELDGTFTMITDDGERLRVNGWMFVIDTIPDSQDGLPPDFGGL